MKELKRVRIDDLRYDDYGIIKLNANGSGSLILDNKLLDIYQKKSIMPSYKELNRENFNNLHDTINELKNGIVDIIDFWGSEEYLYSMIFTHENFWITLEIIYPENINVPTKLQTIPTIFNLLYNSILYIYIFWIYYFQCNPKIFMSKNHTI